MKTKAKQNKNNIFLKVIIMPHKGCAVKAEPLWGKVCYTKCLYVNACFDYNNKINTGIYKFANAKTTYS